MGVVDVVLGAGGPDGPGTAMACGAGSVWRATGVSEGLGAEVFLFGDPDGVGLFLFFFGFGVSSVSVFFFLDFLGVDSGVSFGEGFGFGLGVGEADFDLCFGFGVGDSSGSADAVDFVFRNVVRFSSSVSCACSN